MRSPPRTIADDVAGIHSVAAEGVHRGLSDGIGGKFGDKDGFIAETRKADRRVRLSPAVDGFEALRLHKAFVTGRGEPQHEFADGDNVHSFLPICSDVRSIFFIILPNQGKIVKEWAKDCRTGLPFCRAGDHLTSAKKAREAGSM